jgi:hypothetical protein
MPPITYKIVCMAGVQTEDQGSAKESWRCGMRRRWTIWEPDGLLTCHKLSSACEYAFQVERQNICALLQGKNKIEKYEELARPEYRRVWISYIATWIKSNAHLLRLSRVFLTMITTNSLPMDFTV